VSKVRLCCRGRRGPHACSKTKASCQATADKTAQITVGLDEMANSVAHINDLGTQIATAAEEQSAEAEESTGT